jgi:hypothetical protein
MLKKFTDGLIFGAGFAISCMALLFLAGFLMLPMFMSKYIEYPTGIEQSNVGDNSQPSIPFHDLGLEEQIKQSSVIALAKFELAPDGKMKAIIKEFLKKDPGVTLYYNIGDEHPSSSYYPQKDVGHGDGLVIFFTGSPANMKRSMSYTGDRIYALGDIPIELFKKMCSEPDAKK